MELKEGLKRSVTDKLGNVFCELTVYLRHKFLSAQFLTWS